MYAKSEAFLECNCKRSIFTTHHHNVQSPPPSSTPVGEGDAESVQPAWDAFLSTCKAWLYWCV